MNHAQKQMPMAMAAIGTFKMRVEYGSIGTNAVSRTILILRHLTCAVLVNVIVPYH